MPRWMAIRPGWMRPTCTPTTSANASTRMRPAGPSSSTTLCRFASPLASHACAQVDRDSLSAPGMPGFKISLTRPATRHCPAVLMSALAHGAHNVAVLAPAGRAHAQLRRGLLQGDEHLPSGERVYYDDNGVRYVVDDERRQVRKVRACRLNCFPIIMSMNSGSVSYVCKVQPALDRDHVCSLMPAVAP